MRVIARLIVVVALAALAAVVGWALASIIPRDVLEEADDEVQPDIDYGW